MSFMDEIRKNYTPPAEQPKQSRSEKIHFCAQRLVDYAKRDLLKKAEAGEWETVTTGTIMKKQKRRIMARYDASTWHSGKEPYMVGDEETPTGVVAANYSELEKISSVAQKICKADGIRVLYSEVYQCIDFLIEM